MQIIMVVIDMELRSPAIQGHDPQLEATTMVFNKGPT